jgi:hypothetical protein
MSSSRIRTIGLAFVVVFALSAIVASAASAVKPRFLNASGVPFTFECKEMTGGRGEYETKAKCEKAKEKQTAGGKWERFGKNRFTSSSGEGYLEATNKKITCEADKNTGEITGEQTDLVKVTFTGCTALAKALHCQNTATAGEIQTNWLFSKLGYIKEAAPVEVGLSLTPETAKGLFATFTCESSLVKETVEVGEAKKASEKENEAEEKGGDSIIGKITPINAAVKPPATFSLSFKCSAANTQEFKNFESKGVAEPIDILEAKQGAGKWERACEEGKTPDTLLLEEEAKIEA